MDVERLGRSVPVLVPHFFHDALARDRSSRLRGQQYQEVVFAWPKRELVLTDPNATGRDVDAEIADDNRFSVRLAGRLAQVGTDSRQKFGESKWFGDVVIRAGVEPDHNIGLFAASGEHDDRRTGSRGTHLSAQVDPVRIGKSKIEHHQGGNLRGECTPSRRAIGSNRHAIPLSCQRLLERSPDRRIVLDQQHERSEVPRHVPRLEAVGNTETGEGGEFAVRSPVENRSLCAGFVRSSGTDDRSEEFPMRHVRSNPIPVTALAITVLAAACGSSTTKATSPATARKAANPTTTTAKPGSVDPNAPEVVAPGDIPDTQAFVVHNATGYSFKVPEGWAQTIAGTSTTFTDHYNSIAATSASVAAAPTAATVQTTEVPNLARDVPNFALIKVEAVSRTAGTAVLITYRAGSTLNPVTGKRVAIDVEQYEFWRDGIQVTLTLSGARGSDNVDPWKTVTNSFAWTA